MARGAGGRGGGKEKFIDPFCQLFFVPFASLLRRLSRGRVVASRFSSYLPISEGNREFGVEINKLRLTSGATKDVAERGQ